MSEKAAVLLVDDEPEHVQWLVEYLEARNTVVHIATSLPTALAALAAQTFRMVIADMNIPANEALTPSVLASAPLASRYPGLAVAITARNSGLGAHAVLAYTVHDDDELDAALTKLNCRYVLKGRPRAIKQVLEKSFAPAPF